MKYTIFILGGTFIQCDLYYAFFAGNSTHDLGFAHVRLYHLSIRSLNLCRVAGGMEPQGVPVYYNIAILLKSNQNSLSKGEDDIYAAVLFCYVCSLSTLNLCYCIFV